MTNRAILLEAARLIALFIGQALMLAAMAAYAVGCVFAVFITILVLLSMVGAV